MTPTDKKRGPSMPPPGGKKPGLAVAIAVKPAKSAPGDDKAPDDVGNGQGAGGKVSPEDAVVIRDGKECHMCQMYHPESGECDKVEGYFDPEDKCLRYFVAISGAQDDEESEGEDESAPMPPPGGSTSQT